MSFQFKAYLNLLIKQIYKNDDNKFIQTSYEIIFQFATKTRFRK